MKDLIKQVALEVANNQQVETIPMQLSPTPSDLITAYLLSEDDLVEFATAFLAELSKRAEAVGFCHIDAEEGADCFQAWADTYVNIPVFTFPPINDIEAIENRVAEAVWKAITEGETYEDVVISGEWRKYK